METPKLATKRGVRKCSSVVECKIREAIACASFLQSDVCMWLVELCVQSFTLERVKLVIDIIGPCH